MSVKSRVKEFVKIEGITISEFEKSINASNGYVNSISKSIGLEKIERILKVYPSLNLEWLLTGNNTMLRNEAVHLKEPPEVYRLRTDNINHEQDVPLYNLEASAGLVSLFNKQNDQTPIDYLRIPNLPKCDGALSVTGDSMYPLLKSGDIIMYKKVDNEISNIFFGEMYLVSIEISGDEYISVKWIQRSDKGDNYIKLVSENQHHQPKDIPLSKVRALALVKASVRINSMR